MAARNPFASSVPDLFDPYVTVQARRPARLSTGYYFVRNLLLIGAVAGGLVAAYRNDVFRDLARRVGQEQRYLQAETFLVGSPGWGTPRSMEPVLKQADAVTTLALAAATDAVVGAAPSPAPVTTTPPPQPEPLVAPPQPVAAAPAPSPEPAMAAPAPSPEPRPVASPAVDPLAPVSFDSLPVLNRGAAVQAAALAPAPSRAAAPAPAPLAHSTPAPRSAAIDHSRVKPMKVSLEETPEPTHGRSVPLPTRAAAPPAPRPAPPPVAAKPEPPKAKATDVHKDDNPLLAAVRGAVRSRPPKESVPAAE
jgi:hypothetical protein